MHLTIAEAAEALGLHPHDVYQLITDGRLAAALDRDRLSIETDDLDRYRAALRAAAPDHEVRQDMSELIEPVEAPGVDAMEFLSVTDVADALHVEPRVVYEVIDGGKLAAWRDGKQLLVKPEDLDLWLSEGGPATV